MVGIEVCGSNKYDAYHEIGESIELHENDQNGYLDIESMNTDSRNI
jgi:hypothetical protein